MINTHTCVPKRVYRYIRRAIECIIQTLTVSKEVPDRPTSNNPSQSWVHGPWFCVHDLSQDAPFGCSCTSSAGIYTGVEGLCAHPLEGNHQVRLRRCASFNIECVTLSFVRHFCARYHRRALCQHSKRIAGHQKLHFELEVEDQVGRSERNEHRQAAFATSIGPNWSQIDHGERVTLSQERS